MILAENSDNVERVKSNEHKAHRQVDISANSDAVEDDEDAREEEKGVANEKTPIHVDLLWRINYDAATDHCEDEQRRAEQHCDAHLRAFRLSSRHGR